MRKSLIAVLAVLTLGGCGGAVHVEPPKPTGDALAMCDRLAPFLPQTLDGTGRVESSPASPYVAVWDSGRIALRCGVPRPANMAATDRLSEVNGVGWFPDPKKPTLFTAVTDLGYIELTVSREHTPAGVMVELSEPITKALAKTG
ncbi:Protein of unknown function [Sinosporangium album]|uniref:DUF3515 domain-containing protein n=1 Tax=Sinosporangium album TaxID=504805 RepID=A0A1G8AZL4_9ACTN|nr:DUF3515 domain-containing protein [Sinosporangium album]SDH26296.1 Protein of unknown function [Sinosporangium album]